MNFGFPNGHAAAVPATRIPSTTDNLQNADLNNDHGRWDINLVVTRVR